MVANKDKPDPVGNDGEIVKRETAGLAKIDTQPSKGYSFGTEKIAFLVVLVLVTIVPLFLPHQFIDDWETQILLFVNLPLLAWFVRLVYKDIKRNGK
jgi:cell division protein FtsW (lipid II flippase)